MRSLMAIKAETCDYCGSMVRYHGKGEHILKEHPEIRFVIEGGNPKCSTCGVNQSNYGGLILHYRQRHPEVLKDPPREVARQRSRFITKSADKCPRCGDPDWVKAKVRHMCNVHPEYKMLYDGSGALRCGYCSMALGSIIKLIRHIESDHLPQVIKGVSDNCGASPIKTTKLKDEEKERFLNL